MARSPKHPCIACGRAKGRSHRCQKCGALQAVRQYRVLALLATSPRGRVYLARSPQGRVVLKELAFATAPDTRTLESFEREAEVLTRLEHPRIPRCLESFCDGEGPQLRLYLAQEYFEGENLEQRLAHHTFDEAEAARIAADLLEILAYLHGRSPRIVHRDVKPANVLALATGRFGLVDFGAVRQVGSAGSAHASISGTFGYMPPEQLTRDADPRSDLYALGMTLCRLLSRRPPEQLLGPSLEVRFREHLHVSGPFAHFLDRLVAREPKARFASASEALEQLTSSARALEPRLTTEVPRLRSVPSAVQLLAPEAKVKCLEPQEPVSWTLAMGDRRILLRPGCSYIVGRSFDCDVRVEDEWPKADTVSRRHARLRVTACGLEVEDLGSSNGTAVGSCLLRRAGDRTAVRDGMHLELGQLCAKVFPAFEALDASPPHLPPRRARRLPRLLGYLGGDPEGVRLLDLRSLR